MQKLARVDALQKVLVLIHDMLDGITKKKKINKMFQSLFFCLHVNLDHEERIALFHEAGKKDVDFPFGPFHK